MQRRYCHCGTSIFVDFKPAGLTWRAMFFLAGKLFRARVSRCPRCGELLDIDRLN